MPRLIQGSVKLTMFRMAFPMLAGTVVMNACNLAALIFLLGIAG